MKRRADMQAWGNNGNGNYFNGKTHIAAFGLQMLPSALL
jgi:hypothetical protein